MKPKRKKLSVEDQGKSDQETLRSLFNKKYVYAKNDQWSLKSTSVFGPLMHTSLTDQDAVVSRKDKVEHGQYKHMADSGSGSSEQIVENAMCDEEQFKIKEPGQENYQNIQQESAAQLQEKCQQNAEMEPKLPHAPQKFSSTPWSPDSVSLSPQIRSPRFLKGRQHPPNKFRRKAAPVQRWLQKVDVTLPMPWQCDTLIAEKDKLNTLKDKLSDKEMITWHQHTNFTNPAGKVVGEVKNHYGAELCTQAWCKFHEILATRDVVSSSVTSESQARLNSIHLCEAPGAFITSLNHYLVSRGVDVHHKWSWLGTTLNPYYEGNNTGHMISDDRFIRTTCDNWFFGRDNSGDLMNTDNMLALMESAKLMGDIHLVTADGSIDCQKNPAEQEAIVSRLHHCEVLCSCLLLTPGGTLVIKLFTMFEASSIALLYFLNCAFKQVTICKPATSKSGNSEVYAVCSGYTASLSQDALFSVFAAVCSSEDPHIVLLPREDIPEDFLTAHINCCLYFCQLQSATIARNLHLYGNMTEMEKKRMVELQEMCVEHYVSVCDLCEIDNEDRIRPYGFKNSFSRFSHSQPIRDSVRKYSNHHQNVSCVGSSSVSLPLKRLQGTFHQRQQQNQVPWQQQLEQMHDYVVDENAGQTIRRRQKVSEDKLRQWKVMKGQALDGVASSQFCDCRLLGDLHVMLQHAQVKFHQQKAMAQESITTLTEASQLLLTAASKTHHHHHRHHNPTPIITATYHLPMKDSLTSFWPSGSPELSMFSHQRLSCVEDLQQLEGVGSVGLVVDVTCPQWKGEEEEIRCQTRLLEVVLHVCNYVQSGSSVVLIMPVALTRLTAGLLYIFAGLFHETSFACSKESMFLHQTVSFHNFCDPSYTLLILLETLRHSFSFPPHPARSLTFTEKGQGSGRSDVAMVVDDSGTGRQLPGQNSVSCGGLAMDGGATQRVLCSGMSCDESPHCATPDFKRTNKCTQDAPNHNIAGLDDITRMTGAENILDHSENAIAPSVDDRRMSHDGVTVLEPQDLQSVTSSDLDSDSLMSHDVDLTPSRTRASIPPSSTDTSNEMQNLSNVDPQVITCHEQGPDQDCDDSGITHTHTPTISSHHTDADAENENVSAKNQTSESDTGSSYLGFHCKNLSLLHRAQTSGSSLSKDGVHTTKSARESRGGFDLSVLPGQPSFPCKSQRRRRGDVLSRDWSDSGSGHGGDVSDGDDVMMVPLEVVPVLDIINDVTFIRFLQASNTHTITRFLATLKAAEQRLLNQQEM